MSELKARFIDDTYVEYYNTGKHELAQVYIKSEADKVIATLKSNIAYLRDDKKLTDAILDERNAEIAELKQEIERLKKENEQTLVGVNLRSPTSDGKLV